MGLGIWGRNSHWNVLYGEFEEGCSLNQEVF